MSFVQNPLARSFIQDRHLSFEILKQIATN